MSSIPLRHTHALSSGARLSDDDINAGAGKQPDLQADGP